jgi:hypothetical protein
MNSININILHLVQMVTCSTVDVEDLQVFNSTILACKITFSSLRLTRESSLSFNFLTLAINLSFSNLRLEIVSWQVFSSLVNFSHFSIS